MAWPWNLGYGLFNVIENGTIRQLEYVCSYSHSTATDRILYHFRGKARCWSTIAIFHTPCIRRPRPGGSVRILPWAMFGIGLQKMRIYQMVKKFNDRPMFSRFDTGVWQTDGRTDQDRQHSLRSAMHSKNAVIKRDFSRKCLQTKRSKIFRSQHLIFRGFRIIKRSQINFANMRKYRHRPTVEPSHKIF